MFELPDLPIVSYLDVFNAKIDVVENGSTFEENAIIKVNALPPTLTTFTWPKTTLKWPIWMARRAFILPVMQVQTQPVKHVP